MILLQTVDMAPEVAQDAIDIITQGVEKFGKTQDYEVRAPLRPEQGRPRTEQKHAFAEDVSIREGRV